jgi:hypothetical protein
MSPPASAGADVCKLQELGGECRATPQHTEKSQKGHSNLGHHPFRYLRHVDVANGMILRSSGFRVDGFEICLMRVSLRLICSSPNEL